MGGGQGTDVCVVEKNETKEKFVAKSVGLMGLERKHRLAAVQEASVLASLRKHPNIVGYFESATVPGGRPLVEGEDGATVVAKNIIEWISMM